MTSIFLFIDGKQKGPFFPGQIRSLLAEGSITNETPAWHEGLADWSSVGALLATLPAASGPPPVPPSAMPQPRRAANSSQSNGMMWVIILVVCGFVGIFVLACLAGVALGPITAGIKKAKENMAMQQSRAIALALFTYAQDHNGKYPDGKTSTEVFQALIDDKEVADPEIFFIQMPGKTRPTSNKLTAENVSFDVTEGVTADSPTDLPLVYTTGYTVVYSLGAIATPDPTGPVSPFPGIAVASVDNSARFQTFPRGATSIQLMRQALLPKSQAYQQLKP